MIETQLDPSETKAKILNSARRLFSEHGFHGASIRDIAKDSEVNLAAVNYHFKNKENLFWSILEESFAGADQACENISKYSSNLQEFSMKVFDHFQSNRELMRNTMKLLLSQNTSPPADSQLCKGMAKGDLGPPGGQYFAHFLAKGIPFEMSSEATLWGVKSIFGCIVHWSTMCTTSHFESLAEKNPMLGPEQIRKDVERMVLATIFYIKNHKSEFTNQ